MIKGNRFYTSKAMEKYFKKKVTNWWAALNCILINLAENESFRGVK